MHVVNVLALAGMEYGVIKQVNRLDPGRFSPMICCLRMRRAETGAVLDARVPVFELKKPQSRELGVVVRLARLLRQERVDVVHTHNWQTLFYGVAGARLARIPVVIHGHHGRDAPEIPRRQLLLSRWLARGVTRLTTVAEFLGREVEEEWGLPPERVSVIPNGVELERFGQPVPDGLRGELGLAPPDRIILSIGGLRPVKDHATMFRAFARVLQGHPAARLVVVGGDHGRGMLPRLEALAEELGIRPAVRFTGVRKDVPALLSLCDVYVSSSVFEGMSNTILEAMAAGRPVVATRVGGNAELVQEGASGYLVPPGDDATMAERLAHLLRDSSLGAGMGAAGRARAERAHTMPGMVRGYADLYEDTVLRLRVRQARTSRERIKAGLARSLCWSGLGWLRRRCQPPALTILMYHRVLPLREALDYPIQPMVMPRDEFTAQMAHLARRYRVVSLAEGVRMLAEGRLPPGAVAITFDDGYADNYDHAWPVLRRFGIPGTIFVVTGAIDRKLRLWWDEVAEAVEALSRKPGRDRVGAGELDSVLASVCRSLASGRDARAVAGDVVRRLNGLSREERYRTLAGMRAAALPAEEVGATDLMLTWEQLTEMQRAGIEVGSHTVTHAFLDELDPAAARQEVVGSVARLQEVLDAPARSFAYPRGRVNDWTRSVLRDAGIDIGVTTQPGSNEPGADCLGLRRLDAGYLRLRGGSDPHVLDAELGGWFDWLPAR